MSALIVTEYNNNFLGNNLLLSAISLFATGCSMSVNSVSFTNLYTISLINS